VICVDCGIGADVGAMMAMMAMTRDEGRLEANANLTGYLFAAFLASRVLCLVPSAFALGSVRVDVTSIVICRERRVSRTTSPPGRHALRI
jgi:hypothetical protein